MCWKRSQRTSVNVEDIFIDIYHNFRRSAKLKNFKSNKVRKVINHVSTRWLSLGKCLERTLMEWDPLESYLLSNFDLDDNPTANDPDEKPSREKRFVNVFKQPVSKLYATFLQSVIPPRSFSQ